MQIFYAQCATVPLQVWIKIISSWLKLLKTFNHKVDITECASKTSSDRDFQFLAIWAAQGSKRKNFCFAIIMFYLFSINPIEYLVGTFDSHNKMHLKLRPCENSLVDYFTSALLRDVSAIGPTTVVPKFWDTLTVLQPGGADSAHHCRGST